MISLTPSAGSERKKLPELPSLLQSSLQRLPPDLPARLLLPVLRRVFAEASKQGDLTFLAQRYVLISICDLKLELRLTMNNGRIVQASHRQSADVRIEGVLYAFLLLIAQVEDPDTLFFRRQLRVEGDTELGLYIKNFLAAFEPNDDLIKVQVFLQQKIKALRALHF